MLATQRPAGMVNSDLRSNINLRIALRVASPEDSRDVIESADAARIPAEGSSGRAYAWLGGGHPVAFQTAYVGGIRAPAPAGRAHPRWPARTGPTWGRPPAEGRRPGQADVGEPTDLSVLVGAIGPRPRAEQQRPPAFALAAALPRLSRWPRPSCPRGAGQCRGPLRLRVRADRPAGRASGRSRQCSTSPAAATCLLAGAPQSGRSTLLRTLAGTLAAQVSPDEAHLYVLDGGGALAALAALPHCGAVVTADEPDRVDRLLGRLTSRTQRADPHAVHRRAQ